MRSLLLYLVLGLSAFGGLALTPSKADAFWFRRAYYAPAYYAPAYTYAPAVTYGSYYATPGAPDYTSYYYAPPSYSYYPATTSYYVGPTYYRYGLIGRWGWGRWR